MLVGRSINRELPSLALRTETVTEAAMVTAMREGGAGLRRPGRRSALLCWLDGLNPTALGSWLMRLWQRRGQGTEASKALLGGAATDAAVAAAPAGAGLTASATGAETFCARCVLQCDGAAHAGGHSCKPSTPHHSAEQAIGP